MRSRRCTAAILIVAVFSWLVGGGVLPTVTGQSQATGETPATLPVNDSPPGAAPSAGPTPAPPPANSTADDNLLNLDIDQLSKVPVSATPRATNLNAPSSQVGSGADDFSDAATTGELARQAPSVSTQKTSAINLDPRVRGYHSGELNATANGMSEMKTRLDIDSAFSQIDPGIISDLTVIDGPYTSLYGPGFAFLAADLLSPPRYANGPEAHGETSFLYGSNGQTLYTRENLLAGGQDWGFCFSYGLRDGNNYLTGGADPEKVPSSYQKWDDLFTVSVDVSRESRIQFDYLRTEMNNVLLPGVVYDLDNSTNNQFNVRYIVQEDPKGPRQLELQAWYQQTHYLGDASRPSKQDFYYQFFTLPATTSGYFPVTTVGQGQSDSIGARFLRTFGDRDAPQWTIGADWRRTEMVYREKSLDASGQVVLEGGDVYGIPKSRMDDCGLLTDVLLPINDRISLNAGGRLDYCWTALDTSDPVITQFSDPSYAYYDAGFSEPHDLLGMAYLTAKIKLDQQWTFNAGAAFAMRMPELAELYDDYPFAPIANLGNSNPGGLSTLVPEKDFQFDVGLKSVEKQISYGARGFCAFIHDYIVPVPAYIAPAVPPGDATHVLGRNFSAFPPAQRADLGSNSENADQNQAVYEYENVDLATLAGGDLFAEVRLLDGLSVYGNVAYVCGTDWRPVVWVQTTSSTSNAAGTLVPIGHSEGLPNMYPLNSTLALRVFEPKTNRWLVELSARLVAAHDYVAGSMSELTTPGFITCALRGQYRVNEHLRLTAAVENLLNTSYIEPNSLVILNSQGIPTFVKEPGIGAMLGVDARF